MNTEISTEIIFTEKQDISAVEIFIGRNKFTLTGIDETKPLNSYISSHILRDYIKQYQNLKDGEVIKINDNITLTKNAAVQKN